MSYVNNTLNSAGEIIVAPVNLSVSNGEAHEALLKSAGSKLPVYLDIDTQRFMVDSKIANVGVVQGDSALDLTTALLAKVKPILGEKKRLKKVANNAMDAARRGRVKYNMNKRDTKELIRLQAEREAQLRKQENDRRKAANAQRKLNVSLTATAKATRKAEIADTERAAAAAAKATKGPSWFQRTFGKRTIGGRRRRTYKRRA
jgi:hypothetical protein